MWSAKFFFGIKKIVNYDLNLSKLAFKRAENNFNFISFFFQIPNAIEEVLEEEAALEAAKESAKKQQQQEDACSGKICTANEHCCEGQVCVDTDESKLGGGNAELSCVVTTDFNIEECIMLATARVKQGSNDNCYKSIIAVAKKFKTSHIITQH